MSATLTSQRERIARLNDLARRAMGVACTAVATVGFRSLPDADQSWGGIAAFYCLIHVPREQVVNALRELKRVLKQSGVLLVAFHIGTGVEHVEEFFEKPVDLDFAYFQPAEMEAWLKEAGFEVEEVIVREPNPQVEHPSQRAYLFAQKPKMI